MLYIRSDNECKYTCVFLNSNHVFWKRNLETLPWARNLLVLAVSDIKEALRHVTLGPKGNVPLGDTILKWLILNPQDKRIWIRKAIQMRGNVKTNTESNTYIHIYYST